MFTKVYLGNTPVKAIYQGDKQIQYNIFNFIKYSDRSLDGIPRTEYLSKLTNFTIDKSLYPQLQGKTVTYSIHAFCENATMLANVSGKWSRFGGELAVDYEDGTREYNISAWVFSKSEETLIKNRDERIYGTNTLKDKPIKNIEVRIAIQGLKSGKVTVSKPMLNIGSSNNNYVINPSDNNTGDYASVINPLVVSTDKYEIIKVDRKDFSKMYKINLYNKTPITSLSLNGTSLYVGCSDGYIIKREIDTLNTINHSKISTSKINDIMIHPGGGLFISSDSALIKAGHDSLTNINQTNDGATFKKTILANNRIYALRGNAKINVYDGDLSNMASIEDVTNKESMTIDSTRVHTVGYTNYARFDINTYERSYHKDINMQLKDIIVKDNYLYCLTNTQLYQMEIPTFTSNATLFFPNTGVTCMCLGNDGYIYAGTIDGFILKIDTTIMKIIGSECFTNGSITNIATE